MRKSGHIAPLPDVSIASMKYMKSHVGVIASRAETLAADPLHAGRYDVAVARAVAPLGRLAEWLLPLVRVGGYMVAYKGPAVRSELSEPAARSFQNAARLTEPSARKSSVITAPPEQPRRPAIRSGSRSRHSVRRP